MKRANFRQKTWVAVAALFAITMTFASCERPIDDGPTGQPGDEFTIPDDGKVPSAIIPDEIRALLEETMFIYEGKTPPDITGEYLADSKVLTGSNYPPDEIGKGYLDQYIAFTKGTNGKIRFDSEEHQFGLPVADHNSDNVTVYLVGTGNQFTAYFVETGNTYDVWNKTSTIISGTLTGNGIADFQLAFVMLEKEDPSSVLVPVNTYRVFNESDGLAVREEWLSDSENRNLIINGPEEAWTNTDRNEAYVFTDIGTFTKYTFGNGVWNYNSVGSYSLKGTSLKLNAVDHPFSISADNLKIKFGGTEYTFSRTKPFSAGELDEALILPDGQAWVNFDIVYSGYIFKADGRYAFYSPNFSNIQSEGAWNTSGNSLIITQDGIPPYRYTYSISGGKLTMTNPFGDVYEYTAGTAPMGN